MGQVIKREKNFWVKIITNEGKIIDAMLYMNKENKYSIASAYFERREFTSREDRENFIRRL